MKLREKLIKVVADALYKDIFCLKQGSENGCAACRNDAERRAAVAVDAVLAELRQAAATATEVAVRDERDAITAYLRRESDRQAPYSNPAAGALESAADEIEAGAHRDA